jgi:trk system potassium uptake protein TrkH
VLPALGVGGRLLYQTEVPGLRKESLTPRIAEGALIFWKIYAGLTLLQMALLKWTNVKMGWFDALTISLSTVSTGGFSIRNDGIAAYNSAATDWVVILFMLLGSINFSLYYYVLRGKIYRLYDKELLLFFAIVLAACFFASWNLVGTPNASLVEHSDQVPPMGLKEAIRQGSFQVISIQTTAGFNIADYDSWPAIIQCLLLLLMYVGGMTGSTAGGIKVMRLYLMALIIKNRLLLLFRPDTVRKVYFENREFDDSAAVGALSFFFVTIGLSVIGTFLYIMQGVDPETAMGFVASCINNIGTAFRMNGPRGSSAFLSDSGAWMASLLMLLGRLEFFAVLTLLFPSFWKR